MSDEPTVRLPAWSWHLERLYGEKVPACRNCGSHDLARLYHRDSYLCEGCGMELSPQVGVRFVPKDANARLPDEFPGRTEDTRYRYARREPSS